MSVPLIIYGLGSTGQRIVDDLLDAGVGIDLILDRGKAGQTYRDLPVRALGDADIAGRTVLIALHNHYVDLHQLDADLRAAGAVEILTPVHLPRLVDRSTIGGYWLDPAYDYDASDAAFGHARALLADDTSRALFDSILRYRRTGAIADCPRPSLDDEYTPRDLPAYPGPLRLIDCGAFTGVAIQKFLTAGYAIDSAIAFEPDPASFATLTERGFPIARRLNLPLGTWSSTTQLRFSSNSSMASHLDALGDTVIQCVAIDDLLRGERVNIVKLDVEGAEIETLKGMARLVGEQRPNLLVSAYHTPGHLHEIATLIDDWKLDYRFHLRVHEQNTFGIVLYARPA